VNERNDRELLHDSATQNSEAAFAELVRRHIVFPWFAANGTSVDQPPPPRYVRSVKHELTDEVSLELGRRVAARLCQKPALLRVAHENLDRWSRLNADAPSLLRCYAEWRELLNRPLEEIRTLLSADTEEARRLRQNSPFAGVLSPQEVWEIKRQFRHEATAA
jgi:hypothetical protein